MFSLMLHLTAAAVLIGPQFLMFYAVTPASWFIEDEQLKRNVVGTIARRFGMLAGISIVVLLVTGLYQFYARVPEEIREDMMSYNFGLIFTVKMTMFTVLIVLILVHARIFTGKILRLSDAVIAGTGDPNELERLRLRSFFFSVLLLLASVAVLWLGVALGDHGYSYQPR